ncbi:MAG TPA: O-antigen ligase family protein [Candidatus Paceibacterota bacterium]
MAFAAYLRPILLSGVFVLPFIFFLVSETLVFPFITGKSFAFRILVEILFGLYLIAALADPSLRPKRSWVLWSVCAFVLSALVATILSVDPIKSFWSNFERMEGYLGLLHLAAYFFIAGAVLSTEKLWTRFFQTSVAASAIMGIYVLFQIFGFLVINQGGIRVDGTFGNATYLAVYMLFHIFFTLFLLAREKMSWIQGLYLLALILQTVALFYTATRGAGLGLIGGLLLTSLLIIFFEKERKGLRRIAIGAVAGTLILVSGFFAIRTLPAVVAHPVLSRFASISAEEGTVKARFLVWGMALQGFTDRPVFGWGQENFNFVFNTYYNPEMYAQEQWFDRAHNSFLDWLIAGGLVTFAAYISLFLLVLYALFASRLSFTEKAIFTGLLAAYAFHLSFVFDNLGSSYYFFTLLAFAHFLSRKELPGSFLLTKPVSGMPLALSSVVIGAATVTALYFVNVPEIATAKNLLQAMTPVKAVVVEGRVSQAAKTPQENLGDFKKALEDGGSLGRQEIIEQLLQAAANNARANIDPQAKQEFFDYAYEQGALFLKERQNDARLELFFGAFLDQWKRYDEALVHLTRAHEQSLAKQGILFEIALNSHMAAGNYAEAEKAIKKAYELAPHYDRARIFYAVILYQTGKSGEADALLMERFGTTTLDDSTLLNAYFSAKMYDRVIAIWQKRIEANPLNIQLRVSLAASYLAAEDRINAVRALQEAIQINPDFKVQGEAFIREIQAGRNP